MVVSEADGNRRLIRIDRDRLSVPDDPYLQIPQPEFHEPVRVAVEELTSRLERVVAIVLFGSVARGEADRRSDIDLWVLVGDQRAENQRTANSLAVELEDREFDSGRYAYDIDVETVSSIPKYTDDVREIVVSGVPVHETPEFAKVEKLLLNEDDSDE